LTRAPGNHSPFSRQNATLRAVYYGHSSDDPTKAEWQTLVCHLRNVAEMAERSGSKFGFGAAARLAGALHDLGKYSEAFQCRIEGAPDPVDHATAGAQFLMSDLYPGKGMDKGIAELVAYAIAGHHEGMPDREGDDRPLSERLKKEIEPLAPVWYDEALPLVELTGIDPDFAYA
jgi:CRISPR-associated endonuclease/helicase Cas3